VTAPATPMLCACTRAGAMWAEEELMLSALHGAPLATDLIDQLTPGRARLVVGLALRAGAQLEAGDQALFERAIGDAGPGATGWWRQALGLPGPVTVVRQRAASVAKAANAR